MTSIAHVRFAMLGISLALLACAGDQVSQIAEEYGYGEPRVWRGDVQRRIALPMTGVDTLAEMRDQVVADGVMQNGEIEVKGIHYPVRVYEVVEESSSDAGDA